MDQAVLGKAVLEFEPWERRRLAGAEEIYREKDDCMSKAEAKLQEPNLDKSDFPSALRAQGWVSK